MQKQLILAAVKQLNNHATAEEVYGYIAKDNPTISKATVYRNLSQMAKGGELLSIGALSGAIHYDHNLHKHYHAICSICNKIFDIECDVDLLKSIKNKLNTSNEFEVNNLSISFKGVCAGCSK